jgi:oxygen-independent coproporphyrinogen-3 oxidase
MITHKLHRNFMGYTASKTQVMIGLGVSSISDSWYGFSQNVKGIEDYYHLIEQNIIPVYRGHMLTKEDLIVRQHILNLMCHFETSWTNQSFIIDELNEIVFKLKEMEADGLVIFEKESIKITQKGQPYVRNVCMAFDVLLQRRQPKTRLFSMTV